MKTIKTITTALLLLFTVTAFSQTKEETIDWINQYAGSLLSGEHTTVNIYVTESGEYLKVKGEAFDGKGNRTYNQCMGTIPVNKIVIKPFPLGKAAGVAFWSEICTNGALIESQCDEPDTCWSIFSSDSENFERVYKAIMHLSKLNGAKEEVSKDTF